MYFLPILLQPDPGKTDLQVISIATITMTEKAPHIICVAEPCNEGSLYVVFSGNTIACDRSASRAIDVLLKIFDVFALQIPPLLRKFHEIVSFYLYKITSTCKSKNVAELSNVFREYEEVNQ